MSELYALTGIDYNGIITTLALKEFGDFGYVAYVVTLSYKCKVQMEWPDIVFHENIYIGCMCIGIQETDIKTIQMWPFTVHETELQPLCSSIRCFRVMDRFSTNISKLEQF